MSQPPPATYRLVVLGSGAVGKTALLKRFLDEKFPEKHRETVEDLYSKTYEVNGTPLRLRILDTAGNLPFPAMRRLSIGQADGILLVYAVDELASLLQLETLLEEIKDVRSPDDVRTLPMVLAANKCDLPTDLWQISVQQMHEFMLSKAFDFNVVHLETSAKTGQNVRAIFEGLFRLANPDHKPELDSVCETSPQPAPVCGSPLRQKLRKAHRRFSLQTMVVHANANDSRPETPNGRRHNSGSGASPEERKGSLSEVGPETRSPAHRRASRGFFKRQKTKSQEDLEMPECFVQ